MGKQSEATLLLKIKSAGETVLDKLKGSLSDLRTWAVAAFAAISGNKAIQEFKSAEEASNSLNQALINNGIYSRGLSETYDKVATSLQGVTTFEDDSIKSAMAQMQAYLGQTRISKELMQATLDLATAKKIDLASAADIVGKSIGSSTNALARHGLKLDENASKSEKMTRVIQFLNDQWGGQSEAAAKGLGALDQMKIAIGNLLEAIGERLAPFIIDIAKSITSFANSIMNNQKVISWFEFMVINISKAFTILTTVLKAAGITIEGIFSSLYDAITKLAQGDIPGAYDAIVKGLSNMGNELAKNYDGMTNELSRLDNIYIDEKKRKQEEELRNLEASENSKNRIKQNSAEDISAWMKSHQEKELVEQIVNERLKTDEHLKGLNARIAATKDSTERHKLELEKRRYIQKQYDQYEMTEAEAVNKFLEDMLGVRADKFRTTLDNMSQMQNSKYKELVVLGKAAALANIAIHTAEGAMGAYAAFATPALGPVGPALGVGAAGAVIAYGAEQAGTVAGINMAEGGIVKATPGGVHAVIGEAGRDEAVIPLDGSGSPIMGTTINLVVQGGFLGDRQQAREFAMALDKEFFRLRQSNESMSFDKGVI
jgi:hypothetical protein